jgi:hypothetical protein
METDDRLQLEVAMKKLGDSELQGNVGPNTTHIVIDAKNRTKKVLQGLAAGTELDL